MRIPRKKSNMLASQKKYIKSMHEKGFTSVQFLDACNNVKLYAIRNGNYNYETHDWEMRITELDLMHYYGGMIYKSKNNPDKMLMLTGKEKDDINLITLFELKTSELYQALNGVI
jgi:hypothetical protein